MTQCVGLRPRDGGVLTVRGARGVVSTREGQIPIPGTVSAAIATPEVRARGRGARERGEEGGGSQEAEGEGAGERGDRG